MADATPHSIFHLTNQEIFIITAAAAGRIGGQVATWLMLATLIPEQLRIVAAISPFNFTNTLIQSSQGFVVHLLAEGQQAWVPLFGLYSSRDTDKFAGIPISYTTSGIPLLPDTCGWAECRVRQQVDMGDRILYIADVVNHNVEPQRKPLKVVETFAGLAPEIVTALAQKYQQDVERSRALIKPLA